MLDKKEEAAGEFQRVLELPIGDSDDRAHKKAAREYREELK